jgi:cobalt/nickel transport system permease protein
MALVMPMVGYAVYRALAHNALLTARRRALAAGVGAYVGLNAAALLAAIEFGVQPDLFKDANGVPLYAPFHLSQTIPAMVLTHVFVAGVVEAILTVGVIAYLQKANVPVLRINHENVREDDTELVSPRRLGWRWAWIGLATMVVLTPLGLLAPGGAFGEDAPEDLDLANYHLGAVPHGLQRYAGFWHNALFDGYDFTGDRHPNVGYVVSALFGMLVIALVVIVSFKVTQAVRRNRGEAARV